MMRNPQTENRVGLTLPRSSYGTGANNGTKWNCMAFTTALVILTTDVLGTSATVDVKIESSPDGTNWTPVTGAAFLQKVKATDDNIVAVGELDLRGSPKWLRAVGTVGAAASGFQVLFVGGGPSRSENVYRAAASGECKVAPVLSGTGAAGKYEFSVAA